MDAATHQHAISDVSSALADLKEHWGSAYSIRGLPGYWSAIRRDGKGAVRADNPERLREMIRADYLALPVPRPQPARHAASPQDGTIYSHLSLPSTGGIPGDYPIEAMCRVCGIPIEKDIPGSRWQHRRGISQLP